MTRGTDTDALNALAPAAGSSDAASSIPADGTPPPVENVESITEAQAEKSHRAVEVEKEVRKRMEAQATPAAEEQETH